MSKSEKKVIFETRVCPEALVPEGKRNTHLAFRDVEGNADEWHVCTLDKHDNNGETYKFFASKDHISTNPEDPFSDEWANIYHDHCIYYGNNEIGYRRRQDRIVEINGIMMDFDCHSADDMPLAEIEVILLSDEFEKEVPYTAIVRTGNGFQAHFTLKLKLDDKDRKEKLGFIKNYILCLMRYFAERWKLKADQACKDPNRNYRVPDTWNTKLVKGFQDKDSRKKTSIAKRKDQNKTKAHEFFEMVTSKYPEPEPARVINKKELLPPDSAEIKEALSYINPSNLEYQDWLNIGIALHSWDDVNGLDLWDAWSARDTERYDYIVIDTKWSSFHDGTITVGTLFHYAKENGYTPKGKGEWAIINKNPSFAPLPSFPIDAMPNTLRAMTEEMSKAYQVPAEVCALTLLTTVGLASGGCYKAEVKRGVMARSNLYSLIFLARGERKSTIFLPALKPVEEWISDKADAWNELKHKADIHERRITNLKAEIAKPNTTDAKRQQYEYDLSELMHNYPDDKSPMILADASTPEAMEKQWMETGGKLGIFSDDARGYLKILLGLYTNGQSREEMLLKGFDGTSPYRSSRITRGAIEIENPMLGVLLLVQLDYLKKIGEQQDLAESGHNSRYLFCVPDSWVGRFSEDGKLLRGFSDDEICPETSMQYHNLITNFLDRSFCANGAINIPLEAEAKSIWIKYYEDNEANLGEGRKYADITDIAIRYPCQALRLSIISAICNNRQTINAVDMRNGIKLTDYYALHAERAMETMQGSHMPPKMKRITDYIIRRSLSEFTLRDIERGVHMTKDEAEDTVRRLEEAGYCKQQQEGTENKIEKAGTEGEETADEQSTGRPSSPRYIVNPNIRN